MKYIGLLMLMVLSWVGLVWAVLNHPVVTVGLLAALLGLVGLIARRRDA